MEHTILQPQPSQTPLQPLHQMFPGQPPIINRIIPKRAAPINLGRNNEVIPLPSEFLDRLPHYSFRLAGRVALGAVEEVDAGVVGGFHAAEGALFSDESS